MEYYTDNDCHKLKGQIDLDQCEQVDAGLRMLDKFQHMFDIKTPHRIYYLAAASEEDMRNWVKWICQVCGLQETRGPLIANDSQYLNIGPEAIQEAPINSNTSLTSTTSSDTNTTSKTETSMLNNNLPSPGISLYQNTLGDLSNRANSLNEYCNRETILISEAHKLNVLNNNNSINSFDRSIAETYTNFSTIERASIERCHSLKFKSQFINFPGTSHSRTQSLDEQGATLKHQQKRKNTNSSETKSSPIFSSSSGPYIPISECFSGGAYRVDNKSDTESVFTDDEWTHPVLPHNTLARDKRRSETSLDKDHLSWAYVQRFSKAPNMSVVPPPRPPKKCISGSFSTNSIEAGSNSPLSSPSAFTGPKDRQSSVIEESYDIPRSHHILHNYSNNQHLANLPTPGFSPLDAMNVIASSTPNLIHETQKGVDGFKTLPHSRQNYYTNATSSKVEGTIFRYDFPENVSIINLNYFLYIYAIKFFCFHR